MTKRTKVVNLTAASNTLGFVIDLLGCIKAARSINPTVIMVVDATQLAPHFPLNCLETQADAIVGSAHKMFGPTGIGFLHLSMRMIALMQPIQVGGGMNHLVSEDTFTLVNGITRFEAGTPNIAGAIGFGAAAQYIQQVGMKEIVAHSQRLLILCRSLLAEIEPVTIHNPDADLGIIIFSYKGISAQDLSSYLGTKGFICRAGLSCAKLIPKLIAINEFVRISFHLYNTEAEVKKFCKVLDQFKPGEEFDVFVS
ncbi:unnamed protein product [Didymodactylos carnosus]|uniref:Aminotransferase class V domain-containing protein n=1 Tax=Didymodactylos carnosus TaxID=1234261 RepID=A0A8S2D2N1_9BILA|nr:unnamed protein product [Didymodactylos carnosus]CAF3581138.1 unnamed protein product [Didymodactylos carnosus]